MKSGRVIDDAFDFETLRMIRIMMTAIGSRNEKFKLFKFATSQQNQVVLAANASKQGGFAHVAP